MLVDSPRLTDADRNAWGRLERYDAALAADPRLLRKEEQAVDAVTRFGSRGPCYAGVSWGKDSVVVAHLVALSGVRVPVVRLRMERWENPDCDAVRDRFLAGHPDCDYHEIVYPPGAPRWWEADDGDPLPTTYAGFDLAAARFGDRHISGVRADESTVRRIAMRRWGTGADAARTCRPVGWWTAVDVFAYLHLRGLPVHPAYAQTVGGHLDRGDLRVHSLGGVHGAASGRSDWEARYYPDVVGTRP